MIRDFVACQRKTAINIIEYSIDKIIPCLSILVRLAKKCFCGVTIPDVGMRDKRHQVIPVLCTQRRRLDRIKRCKQVHL